VAELVGRRFQERPICRGFRVSRSVRRINKRGGPGERSGWVSIAWQARAASGARAAAPGELNSWSAGVGPPERGAKAPQSRRCRDELRDPVGDDTVAGRGVMRRV
jgi:hypothetical protein